MLFVDPESPTNVEVALICESCSDNRIFEKLMEQYDSLKRQKDAMIRQQQRNRAIAKQNDTYYLDQLQPKIDSLIQILKDIRWNQCRYEHCGEKLSNLRQNIWNATHFSYRGKFRQAYYFCTRAHWNVIRARCGLKATIPRGQLTIPQSSN